MPRPIHIARSLVLVAGMTLASSALGSDYTPRDVGEWTVAVSEDGKGCFVSREYDRTGETALLLGLDGDGTNRLTVLNANWSIKPKDKLELNYRLSNASFPKHFAIGIVSGGKPGFVTSFGGKFPALFAASTELRIFRNEVPVERLDLSGSGAAVAEMRKCVQAQRATPAAARREKGVSDSIPKDPFAPGVEKKRRK